MWRGTPIAASACLAVVLGSLSALSAQEPRPPETRSAQERRATEQRKEYERRVDPTSPRSELERERLERMAPGTLPKGDDFYKLGSDARALRDQQKALRASQPRRDTEQRKAEGAFQRRLDKAQAQLSLLDSLNRQRLGNSIGELQSPQQIRTAKAWLSELGYYRGPLNDVVGPVTRAAIKEFMTKEGHYSKDPLVRAGLKKYADLSPALQAQVASKIPEWLADLGFPPRNLPVEENLRQYQQFRAIPPTGSIGPETASAINEDLRLRDQVLETPYSDLSSLSLRSVPGQDGFSGYLRDGHKLYFLVRRKTPELWVLNELGTVEIRLVGMEAVDQFHSAGRTVAAKNSSGNKLFLYAARESAYPNSTIDLQIGSRRFFLSGDEFAALLQSPTAPSEIDEAFALGPGQKRTVVVSGESISGTAVADLLKTRYGQAVDVFLSRDASTVSERLDRLSLLSVGSSADLMVYTAKNILDYGTIENLKENLARAHIEVVEDKWESVSERWVALSRKQWTASNVIVIAGHRDSSMSRHLIALQAAGALKGKLVVVASCYEPGVETLQSDLMAGYLGAAGVIFYRDAVKASAVEAVMREFIKLMRSESLAPTRIDVLLKRSVDRALERADMPSEREEIEKLRHTIFQISRLRPLGALSDTDA